MPFVVTMYRWGVRDRHSYVLGVFRSKSRALSCGLTEEQDRGGKYTAEILNCPMGRIKWDSRRNVRMQVKSLPKFQIGLHIRRKYGQFHL